MANEIIKKDLLAGYVHDAVSMEVRRHTISKTRDELVLLRNKRLSEQERAVSLMNSKHKRDTEKIERELNSIEDNHASKAASLDKRIKWEEDQIDTVKEKPYKITHPFEADPAPIAGFGLLGMIVGLVGIAILGGIGLLDGIDMDTAISVTYSIGPLCGMIIGVLITYIIQKVIWKKDCQYFDRVAIEKAHSNIMKLQAEQETALKNYKKERSQKQLESQTLRERQLHERTETNDALVCEQKVYADLTAHIDEASDKLNIIDSQLTEFYSVNLIPPDYRSLECVIAFNQMFRNDLVDTMREAALLYEERVFRGEMIKGLNNIYEAINELGGLMTETVSVLRDIESNTSRMCDELVEVSSNLVRMNANVTGHLSTMSSNLSSGLNSIADGQRRIESELEYNRYTNEAIRANSDRMRWYTEQRWQGLL